MMYLLSFFHFQHILKLHCNEFFFLALGFCILLVTKETKLGPPQLCVTFSGREQFEGADPSVLEHAINAFI